MASPVQDAEQLLDVSQQTTDEIAHILTIMSVEILSLIMKTEPTSGIKVIKAENASYARWRVSKIVQDILKSKNWATIMGAVKEQGDCESCWAVVVTDLVSALLFLKGVDKVYTEYSIQELLDFADLSKVGTSQRQGHYCYLLTIRKGLLYVLNNGLQRETDRPYVECRHQSQVPPRTDSGRAKIGGVEKLSMSEALIQLESQPIGASLAIFMPDYGEVKGGVYRGPMKNTSTYEGMHGVTITGVAEEDGESLFVCRSTHGQRVGEGGYLKVSMEVMLVQVPMEGDKADGKFDKPMMLLTNFVCPTLDIAMQED